MWWFQLIQEKQKLHAMQLHLQLFERISTRTVRLLWILFDSAGGFVRACRIAILTVNTTFPFCDFIKHQSICRKCRWTRRISRCLQKNISVLNIVLVCGTDLRVSIQGVGTGWWRPLALNLPPSGEPDGRTERASEALLRQEPWHIPPPHLLPGKTC